jgi:peptide/nickel transport system ATP-binding protein
MTPLLEVQNLKMYFPIRQGFLNRPVGMIHAVNDVSFTLQRGETLGLVGESGCGKTTIGRCIVRAYRPTGGAVLYHSDQQSVDLAVMPEQALKPYRQRIRMIFQDPFSSLNPRMTVFDIVADPLRIHGMHNESVLRERVSDLLLKVGLRPEYMRRYPHAFSGGQRQRIGIARALALNPEVVIADEAVSALDVSVRAQILNLLLNLQQEMGLTYLFVSHDLSVVEYLADRVAVMYLGRLVEIAPTTPLYQTPRHPYTEALLSAIPRPDPHQRRQRLILSGEVGNAANLPTGCAFHPRCRFAQERCRMEVPILRPLNASHQVACHFAEELTLQGILPKKGQSYAS